MFETTKQAFSEARDEARKERRQKLESAVYDNTGILGRALKRYVGGNTEEKEKAAAIRLSNKDIVAQAETVKSIELNFIRMSKGLDAILKAVGAETDMVEEERVKAAELPKLPATPVGKDGAIPGTGMDIPEDTDLTDIDLSGFKRLKGIFDRIKKKFPGGKKSKPKRKSRSQRRLEAQKRRAEIERRKKERQKRQQDRARADEKRRVEAEKKRQAEIERQRKIEDEKAKRAKKAQVERTKLEAKANAAKKAATEKALKKGASKEAAELAGRKAAKNVVKDVVLEKSIKAVLKNKVKRQILKTGLKSAVKSIPVVGLLVGGGFAIARLIEGDLVGAGIEVVSGVAGPATSIAADIAQLARDEYKAAYGVFPEADDPELRDKRLAEIKAAIQEAASEAMNDLSKKQREEAEAAAAATNEFGDDYQAVTPEPAAPIPQSEEQKLEEQLLMLDQQIEAANPEVAKLLRAEKMKTFVKLHNLREAQPETKPIAEPVSAAPITNKPKASSGGDKDIKSMIIKHEGIRYKPYKDSLGLWTVGVGHLIGDGKSLPSQWNRALSHNEVMELFDTDYEHHKQAAQNIPGYTQMNRNGQAALIDLTFNMGPKWYKKWPNLMKQFQAQDYSGAADNLANSKWARQVKGRSDTITELVRNAGNDGVEVASITGQLSDVKKAAARGQPNIIMVDNSTTLIKKKAGQRPPSSPDTIRMLS